MRRAQHEFALSATRMADRSLITARVVLGRLLDRVQFRLRVLEVSLDPNTTEWLKAARASVADGSIWKEIEEQPNPMELLEQRRSEPS
jgi:hypothetical protein